MSHQQTRCGQGRRRLAGPGRWAALGLVYLSLAGTAAGQAPTDPLEALLRGEFALQEGRTDEAASRYAEAALDSSDPALLERATRLALMSKDVEAASRLLARWLELAPDEEAAQQIALVIALREADAKAGERALRRILARPEGWKRALQAMASDSTSLLVPALLQSLLKDPAVRDNLDALLAAGGLADRLSLEGLRAKVGGLAVEHHAQQPRAWLWQADLLRKQDKPAEARAAIEKAIALPGLDQPMRLAAAGMLGALGEHEAAAEALAGGEQDAASWAARAAFLARTDDRERLAALYAEVQTAAERGEPDAEHRFLLGQLAELLELKEAALGWYRSLPDGPRAGEAQLRIALLSDDLGQHETALGVLRELQQRDSDDGRLLIDAYLLEAQLLQRHGRHAQAVDAYARGLAVFEDEPALLYGRALAYERLDKIDLAEADLRLMLVMDPENPDALNALGYTLADRTERLAEAHELIRQALALRPDNPAIIDSMGWVLFRMGRVEEALPHLRRAFELQRDAEVAAHLGEALWASGKKEEARSIWRLGREIDPDNPALKRSLEQHGIQP
ncbi:tetratricopeptide repeat protein [Pseudomarimonas salicorniae]|uniref:Tetratricopeptide repeat protein n=1 Tax=Pseudomarimonas salicorniae TaxID=2933270 RepID=A0ABT0GIB2_9GAMM|nr:tetratricopeptide repeat protein [Lysobacter sp. CAU 1642]MCK7594291.1 tetratricopeptide repeat protein [Lysobacter sp. CAU 1642]